MTLLHINYFVVLFLCEGFVLVFSYHCAAKIVLGRGILKRANQIPALINPCLFFHSADTLAGKLCKMMKILLIMPDILSIQGK